MTINSDFQTGENVLEFLVANNLAQVGIIVELTSSVCQAADKPPIIEQHPGDVTVRVGETALFSVGASPTCGNYTYQWRHNGTNISGATQSTFVIPDVQTHHAGFYDALVSIENRTSTSQRGELKAIDPSSRLEIRLNSEHPTILIHGQPGARFYLMSSPELQRPEGWDYLNLITLDEEGKAEYTDTLDSSPPIRFYRSEFDPSNFE